jgi:hypothetical protein
LHLVGLDSYLEKELRGFDVISPCAHSAVT